MLTGTYMLWFSKETGLSVVAVKAFTPFLTLSASAHAVLVFSLSMAVVMMPKIVSLLDLMLDPVRRQQFGGMLRASTGVFIETLFSTLHAPVQMMFHTKFVLSTLLGFGVHWGSQQRTADGIGWGTALRNHWGHTTLAILWGGVTWSLDPSVFWWFLPVLAGLALSIPISVATSRESLGRLLARMGLLTTPEEIAPPAELARLESSLQSRSAQRHSSAARPHAGLCEAVLDPYVNALHVSLLEDAILRPRHDGNAAHANPAVKCLLDLGETLLTKGPESLSAEERMAVLADADILSWLHHEAWCRRGKALAGCWQVIDQE
jgi:membrane glycosyltransferase